MNQTTLVFLKSFLSRNRFEEALAWVKSFPVESRLYLPEPKLWVLDLESTPADIHFENILEEVSGVGWTIVGSTLWDTSLPLRGNEKALVALSNLIDERKIYTHRNPK